MQVKLLRLLQEDEVRRVGETKSSKVDVRIVAATARDLAAEVKAGRFREDLFYRLNVLPIHLPPLRERKEDIPLLVEHFLGRHGQKTGSKKAISPAAMQALLDHGWTGNVRELENTLERATVLAASDVIEVSDLPDKVRAPTAATTKDGDAFTAIFGDDLSIKKAGSVVERELIRRALVKTKGNRTQAAELLDLSARALLYKIRDYGLE
jgi:two-component system response regulator AtoC